MNKSLVVLVVALIASIITSLAPDAWMRPLALGLVGSILGLMLLLTFWSEDL